MAGGKPMDRLVLSARPASARAEVALRRGPFFAVADRQHVAVLSRPRLFWCSSSSIFQTSLRPDASGRLVGEDRGALALQVFA